MLLPGVLSRTHARRWWPLRLAVVGIVAKSSPRSISPLAPTSVPKARCLLLGIIQLRRIPRHVQAERTACCAHLAAEVRTQRRPGSCVLSASGFASLSYPASRRQGVSRSVDSAFSGCVIRAASARACCWSVTLIAAWPHARCYAYVLPLRSMRTEVLHAGLWMPGECAALRGAAMLSLLCY